MKLVKGQRVIAIGDIHGDLQALSRLLKTSQVIDKDAVVAAGTVDEIEWTGGTTIVVQNGDVLDRGITELSCWRLLANLARQAQSSGGGIHLLFGNHEALNILNVWNYVEPGADNEFDHEVSERSE